MPHHHHRVTIVQVLLAVEVTEGEDGRQVDERPYNGRVNGLKEFDAFVQLEGVSGRVEGASSSLRLK